MEADAEEPVLSEAEGIYAFFRFRYAVFYELYEHFQPGLGPKFSCDCPVAGQIASISLDLLHIYCGISRSQCLRATRVHIHFLYPSQSFEPRQPDEAFQNQINEMQRLGFGTSIVCLEELGQKSCRIRGPVPEGATVIYRGWMPSPGQYEQLVTLIKSNRATPFISPEMYLACHYLPNWYPLISEFTPETKVLPLNSDFVAELQALGWQRFFIKDYVKSLKTSIGSVISKPEDIGMVLSEMQRFRDVIEGGVCVRRFEQFVPNSETRYFVIRGKPYAASGSVPEIVWQ